MYWLQIIFVLVSLKVKKVYHTSIGYYVDDERTKVIPITVATIDDDDGCTRSYAYLSDTYENRVLDINKNTIMSSRKDAEALIRKKK